MTLITFYQGVGVVLFLIGFAGVVLRPEPLQRLLSINVMGVGVFMWLIATAFQPGRPDSVPHALVLTGIVVAVSATAFALALLVRLRAGDDQGDTEDGQP